MRGGRGKLFGRGWRHGLISYGLLLLILVAAGAQLAAARTPLSREHKKWLEEEVVYIISDEEKQLFLSLPSDVEREQFIAEFWEIRDPTPATPENEYKEEHYRRIDYANRYFGFDSGDEGWDTDRGRIYIQLGEPQQRIQHRWLGEIRPLELWFYYQNDHPSLPNAFNVMFFRPDASSGWRIYSPYIDGPDKLVKRTGAENDPLGSYQYLKRFDPEIARASVTLLTDEPISPEGFSPSLASDSMLTRIRNLPNDRFTKELLERRRQLKEVVKTRVVYEPGELDVLAVPLLDPDGNSFVHFLLVLPDNLERQVPKDAKRKQVAATVSVLVRTPSGEQLFQQAHRNLFDFRDPEFKRQRDLPVGYEDRLPLPPGKYDVTFVFRNELTEALYRSQQRLEVPAPAPTGLQLSPPVMYDKVERRRPGDRTAPFQFSDFKLVPTLQREIGVNNELSVFFQIHSPGAQEQAGELTIDYTLGSLGSSGNRQTLTEEIDKGNFDAHGNVAHSKTFPLNELSPGSYHLVVKVTDPVTRERASQTLTFRLLPGRVARERVVLVNDQFEEDLEAGRLDYRRGVSQIGVGRVEEGVRLLQNALKRNSKLHEARGRLAAVYFEQGQFDQVAALLPPDGLSRTIDVDTARRFVASFEKIGDVAMAIELAKRALVISGPQLPLYEDLLRLYEESGQGSRAAEVRRQMQQLAPTESE